jgi:hypothetical protein
MDLILEHRYWYSGLRSDPDILKVQFFSVADPGCLSRDRILIFTDPGSQNSNKGEG